jgi:hypothetical protein
MEAFSKLRREMVEKAIVARGVRSELVLDAMRSVPSEAFLPQAAEARRSFGLTRLTGGDSTGMTAFRSHDRHVRSGRGLTAAPTMGLRKPRFERAIGVIYRPETELASHYFQTVLPDQFDEYVWFDETTAITPFEMKTLEDLPDTYPFGL